VQGPDHLGRPERVPEGDRAGAGRAAGRHRERGDRRAALGLWRGRACCGCVGQQRAGHRRGRPAAPAQAEHRQLQGNIIMVHLFLH